MHKLERLIEELYYEMHTLVMIEADGESFRGQQQLKTIAVQGIAKSLSEWHKELGLIVAEKYAEKTSGSTAEVRQNYNAVKKEKKLEDIVDIVISKYIEEAENY